MKLRHLTPALLCLLSFSCDKAKNLFNQAKATVENKVATGGADTADTKPDPELQKLVDQTPDGVIFRKDLPFPTQLTVKVSHREEYAGRFTQKSELGSQAAPLNGTLVNTTQLTRNGDKVTFTFIDFKFIKPEDQDQAPDSAKKMDPKKTVSSDPAEPPVPAPPPQPHVFVKSGSTWKPADSTDFSTAALAQQLSPVFQQILIENALAPRTLWFGKRRIKLGESLTLSGTSLAMLNPGSSTGKLILKLESISAVGGHPCGVFTYSGDYSRKQFPDLQGNLTDQEVTIQSGKIWLSLLHPLVLRMEAETIQTTKSGGHGGLTTRGQGASKVSNTIEWKSTAP